MIETEVIILKNKTEINHLGTHKGFLKCSPLVDSLKNLKLSRDDILKLCLIDFRFEFYIEITKNYQNLPIDGDFKTSGGNLHEENILNIASQIKLEDFDYDFVILDFTWETSNYRFGKCLLEKVRSMNSHVSSEKIIFITSNCFRELIDKDFYCDIFFESYSREKFKEKDAPRHIVSKKDKRFISLNRKPRTLRINFVESLYENNLQNLFYLSHPKLKNIPEKQLDTDLCNFDMVFLSTKITKHNIDTIDYGLNKEDFFNSINNELFEKSFWNVVTESYIEYESDIIFVTEKTFKCLYAKMPFLIYGSPGTLRVLKSLGYRTFSDYIDESYDLELNDVKRLNKIIHEIKKLSFLDNDEFIKMYSDIEHILDWNQKLFLKRFENQEIGKKLVDFLENSKYN